MADLSRVGAGAAGERRAERWYVDHGFEVLDRNWRRPGGELDLVVARDPMLVFVEVKWRRRSTHGGPGAAIDCRKAERVRATAERWLVEHPEWGQRSGLRVRFDAALGIGGHLDVIEGAF
jgi:putative endonuclease